MTTERDKTEEIYVEQQKAVHTALASHKYIENNHTALTVISVQAVTVLAAIKFDEVTAERDKTEELYVEQQNAVHTALASHKYFENNNYS